MKVFIKKKKKSEKSPAIPPKCKLHIKRLFKKIHYDTWSNNYVLKNTEQISLIFWSKLTSLILLFPAGLVYPSFFFSHSGLLTSFERILVFPISEVVSGTRVAVAVVGVGAKAKGIKKLWIFIFQKKLLSDWSQYG